MHDMAEKIINLSYFPHWITSQYMHCNCGDMVFRLVQQVGSKRNTKYLSASTSQGTSNFRPAQLRRCWFYIGAKICDVPIPESFIQKVRLMKVPPRLRKFKGNIFWTFCSEIISQNIVCPGRGIAYLSCSDADPIFIIISF